jgi:transcriptional regulator with XRE-family HTH domain
MKNFLPIAEQLRILLENVTHPSGRAYTMQEVSEATGISTATLSQIRTGKIKNPQINTLSDLSTFFNVPLRYFQTCTLEECFAILQGGSEEEPKEISEIAFRASQLSPEYQRDILTIIKWAQAAEQAYKEGKGGLPSLPHLNEDDKR